MERRIRSTDYCKGYNDALRLAADIAREFSHFTSTEKSAATAQLLAETLCGLIPPDEPVAVEIKVAENKRDKMRRPGSSTAHER